MMALFTKERVLLSHEECRYRGEKLFFEIMEERYSQLDQKTKIKLHKYTIIPIVHFILELERLDELAFYHYAATYIEEYLNFLNEMRSSKRD